MTTAQKIGVVLVDDHEVTRIGLSYMLKSFDDITLLGEAETGEEALRLCAATTPEVVLMDMLLGEQQGPEVIAALRRQQPGIKVIALSSFDDRALVERALQAGAISYMLKNISAFDLIQTIRRASQGKTTLAPEAAQALVEQLQQPARAQVELTRREWAVLRRMAHGQSNGEIAEQLHISAATVKGHVGTILEKLGVTTRAAAIARAWTRGLVRRDEPLA
ncbi:MAG: response regulator transcription factor [Chloroflexales bacterium]|nr:response regulator transcription factor [Chloroflexales bacterium]